MIPNRGDAHHVPGVNHVELHVVESYVLEEHVPKTVCVDRHYASVVGGRGTKLYVGYREYSQFKSLVSLAHIRLQ